MSPQFHVVFDDQFTTVGGSPDLLTEEFYQKLYSDSSWLYRDNYGDPTDLYLFEPFWSEPPLLKKPSMRPVWQTKHRSRHPPPLARPPSHKQYSDICPHPSSSNSHAPTHRVSVSSDTRHESSAASTSDSNIPPQRNPDRHLTSDQAVDDSDHASLLVREQATNNGEHAHTSTSDHTAIQGEHATSLTVNHVESPDYEHNSKGIKANIYTAHFTLNHTSSSPTSQLALESTSQDVGILSYTFAATTPIPDPSAQDQSDNKTDTNGTLSKYKSRLCINGKEQALGRDYWETYAPVAAWSTIHLLLYLSTILNLHTHQVDYTSAFPQVDLDVPVYMRVPQGWFVHEDGQLHQHPDPKSNDTKNYLRLKKNMYGCKQAARNWFKLLSEGLRKEGFIQSKTDSCLFLCTDCIIVIYVDDCLFFSPHASTVDNVIASLSKSFKLKDEGDVSAFLGVQI